MNGTIYDRAHEYAMRTTNTRCPHIGECEICSQRFCDYASRYTAFINGYNQALDFLCNLDFDKVMDQLMLHMECRERNEPT